MLISSRNTLTDPPRSHVILAPWALSQVQSTQRINCHRQGFCLRVTPGDHMGGDHGKGTPGIFSLYGDRGLRPTGHGASQVGEGGAEAAWAERKEQPDVPRPASGSLPPGAGLFTGQRPGDGVSRQRFTCVSKPDGMSTFLLQSLCQFIALPTARERLNFSPPSKRWVFSVVRVKYFYKKY